MGAIEILLLKAAEEGIEVSGVKPISFPGRGIGVVATRNIKVRSLTFPSQLSSDLLAARGGCHDYTYRGDS